MTTKLLMPLFAICIFINSCKSNVQYLDKRTFDKIIKICPGSEKSKLLVYYFDGDCSLCIGKAKYLEDSLKNNSDIKPIFIAQTLNPDIFRFNVDQLHMKSCFYIEKDKEFNKLLTFNEIIMIDKDRSYKAFQIKN